MDGSSELTQLCSEVARILNVDDIDPDAPLAQLGIDSLNVVELILACQQIYPNARDFESLNFDEHSTLREIHERLTKTTAPAA